MTSQRLLGAVTDRVRAAVLAATSSGMRDRDTVFEVVPASPAGTWVVAWTKKNGWDEDWRLGVHYYDEESGMQEPVAWAFDRGGLRDALVTDASRVISEGLSKDLSRVCLAMRSAGLGEEEIRQEVARTLVTEVMSS